MNIDLATLYFILPLALIIQAGTLVFHFRTNRNFRGIGWWALGSVATAFGFMLNFFRGLESIRPFAILIGNPLLWVALLCSYVGIRRFFGQREHKALLASVWLVFVVAFSYVTVVSTDANLRILMFSCAIALGSFGNAAALLKNRTQVNMEPILLTTAAFLLIGGIFAYRVVALTLLGENYWIPSVAILAVTSFISSTLWTFWFITLIIKSLHEEV